MLLLDEAVGWYRALLERMSQPSEDDWKVDVVIKPIGWIGTYRKSPTTGLWHAGDHDLHLRGK